MIRLFAAACRPSHENDLAMHVVIDSGHQFAYETVVRLAEETRHEFELNQTSWQYDVRALIADLACEH